MLKYISSLLILFTFSVADMIDYYMMAILPSLPKEQAPIPNDGTLTGKVQKGPFKAGTVITVQEINKQLDQTGTSFSTEVINNLGDYRLNFNTNPIKMAEFFALGYYFDEVNNQVSSSQLQLSTISDFSYKQSVNINIISSLLRPRIRYLISNEGKDFQQAKDQAENEVLAIFNITGASLDFEDLDISVEDESNAILLAISAILMQQATDLDNGAGAIPGRLTEIITLIKYDIETDGVLDDQSVLNGISTASQNLNIPNVRENLINYGYTTLPIFEDYIDADGDGLMGSDEKAPIVSDVTFVVPQNDPYDGVLSGTDGDGDSLTFTTVSNPIYGQINLDSNGSFTYTPNTDYSGDDSFTYRAFDKTHFSNTATVTIHVNNPPVFTSDENKTILDNSTEVMTIVATDSDVIAYTIFGTDADKFEIDSSLGVLSLKALLDWDNPSDSNTDNVYELDVNATDSYGNVTTQSLKITVKKYRFLGSFTMEDNATVTDILVEGNYAYVTDLYNGLYIFDVSDPANIVQDSFISVQYFRTMQKVNNTLYIVYESGLKAIDVTDKTAPSIAATYPNTVRPYHSGFHVEGNILYCIDSNYDFRIFDISDPNSISSYATLDVKENLNNHNQLIYNNNIVYFAGLGLIQTIDVSDINNPTVDSNYTTNGGNESVKSLKYANNALFASTLYNLDIANSTDPNNLVRYGEFSSSGHTYRFQSDMDINANFVFTAAGNGTTSGGVNIIDKSTLSAPALIEEIDLDGRPYEIEVVGDNAYVDDRTNHKFIVLDISDYN